MADLQKHKAKLCWTAAGILILEEKVLFIKHKKLGIWFCPGGHVDEDELPHKSAEREFWEETGVKVRAIDPYFYHDSKISEYLPSPIESNLHWVSQENYEARQKSGNLEQRNHSKLWPKGCEQHLGFLYLVEAIDDQGNAINEIEKVKFKQNIEETDGIAWFTLDELEKIETNDDMRQEVRHAMEVIRTAEFPKK